VTGGSERRGHSDCAGDVPRAWLTWDVKSGGDRGIVTRAINKHLRGTAQSKCPRVVMRVVDLVRPSRGGWLGSPRLAPGRISTGFLRMVNSLQFRMNCLSRAQEMGHEERGVGPLGKLTLQRK
jgi:hypothetical protein